MVKLTLRVMNNKELKKVLSIVRNYFPKQYPRYIQFMPQIESFVVEKVAKHFDPEKGKLFFFIKRSIGFAWSEMLNDPEEFVQGITDEDGLSVKGKKRTQYFSDLQSASRQLTSYDAEKDEPFDTNSLEDILSTEPSQENDFPDTEITEKKKTDAYLKAFYKIQLLFDETVETSVPLRKKYLESIPTLSIPSLNARKAGQINVTDNLAYHKFSTWLDKSNTRVYQEMALEQLLLQKQNIIELYGRCGEAEKYKGKIAEKITNFPLTGAVLVSKEGKAIAMSYKDCSCEDIENRLAHPCEYLLFRHQEGNDFYNSMQNGSLFITLEPGASRITSQLPCAVRCLESGIRNICIGTVNIDRNASGAGINILETGCYTFDKSISFYQSPAVKELITYFRSKGYEETESVSEHCFFIAKPLTVSYFYPDLSLEIVKHNGYFIRDKNPHLF
jgi:pyrimidine deaminase RibD-like protein